ncbi:heat shock 70 kDa protein 12A-like isoform X3 [Dreissena polymorpha]|uniref:heat shock 70 kDa protein 12A-like isoform X3 n=1 Tax=Dreissena polymorpha TaxID=45954 RepID=UPI0022643BA8|nr:heat shock 70 kDa protein 12A-like isoform X3 [Dreissena polymorpha]XP_052283211.1 heat shock 70 kDa protein 12A-like isoform X3 [Dreissena polymorpha]
MDWESAVIVQRPDGKTLEAFAYDAENQYSELSQSGKHTTWYFFRRFKMSLWNKPIHKETMVDDECGRKLPALTVFSLSIRYMKEDLEKISENRVAGLKPDDIHWVLTVPAIWNDSAKQFMRLAAEQAGISKDKLSIALEPEAASLYCRHLPVLCDGESSILTFQTGKKYLVVDAGGGTIDITVHEVCAGGNLKEIHRASGGDWGGTKIDGAFMNFLGQIAGNTTMQRFKDENMEDYLELLRDFEIKKRDIAVGSKTKVTIKVPSTLFNLVEEMTHMSMQDKLTSSDYGKQVSQTGNKIRLDADLVRSFFSTTLTQIITHTSDLLEKPDCVGVEAILMVGGFSESKLLQEIFKLTFSQLKIVIPAEAGLAVLKGAVIFGHCPTAINVRISKYTYGVQTTRIFDEKIHPSSQRSVYDDGTVRCINLFDIIVREGDKLVVGGAHTQSSYRPVNESQKSMNIPIFISRNRNAKFTTDLGCTHVGTILVPLAGRGTDRSVTVRMLFGGTEIIVECVENATNRIRRLNIDFLT